MGRQWNTIIESLGPLSGGTGLSINANLTELEALVTTLQADVADGILVTNGTVNVSKLPTSGSSSLTSFTSSTSAQVLPSNSNRKIATIFNSTPNTLYLSLGTTETSSTNYSFALGEKELLNLSGITTAIQGIYVTSGTAKITELT
jgi:hypothetical protein